MEKIIKHYGVKRRSGRYPWGSGDDPYQDAVGFLGHVKELEKQGLSQVEIAKGLGITTTELRAKKHIAYHEKREADATMALRLKDKGYSTSAIARRMGKNESSIRALLDPAMRDRANMTIIAAEALKSEVDSGRYLDIGTGSEINMGISRTKLLNAVAVLKEEGYTVHVIKVKQLGTDKYTNIQVLAPPEATLRDVSKNREKVGPVGLYVEDGGRTVLGIEPPAPISSDRVLIRYAGEGGELKDGVLELRRGVDDISLGNSRYSQVRVNVDDSHYMKGMAIYGDKFPDGIDVIYNTTKKPGTPKEEVFKSLKDDPDNPFGTIIRQKHYIDPITGEKKLSAINLVGQVEGSGEEGSWGKWSKNISSQVLSKQSPALIQSQLDLAFKIKSDEFDEIMSLTNPAVKKALLQSFADDADASAVHLKAAALPRQATQVLLPVNSLKDNEVYAPNFRNGETVVLIRHPHGGVFEIPELRVNNKNPEGASIMGKNPLDAVGINSKVAAKLSGADFDGDTVIVIPNNNKQIRTSPSLKALKDFDPKTYYPEAEGMKYLSKRNKQMEMGKITNLITDMTVLGASQDEIARAVKHSMVVIDAEKHKLNYTLSYADNGIAELKEKYQGSSKAGASTLISRASSTIRIPQRVEGAFKTDPKTGKTKKVYIDPDTGKKIYSETGETYTDSKGKVVKRLTKTTRMDNTDDAFTLSSGSRVESIYANYANALKNLGNKARKNFLNQESTPYSPSARATYKEQVDSLNKKLKEAFANKPLERKAQLVANKIVAMKKKDNPDLDPAELKKIKGQALEEARLRVGAKKPLINITDKEWNAIQAGALSTNALDKILANTDLDSLKQRALPKQVKTISPTRVTRAKYMLSLGNTRAEVADTLGISISVLNAALDD